MQIQKSDRVLISELYNETNPYKICDIFEDKLIYFNLGINPRLESFKNNILNNYSILGISDYEKSYIFDNKYNSKETRVLEIGKTINLDLNILTYLKKNSIRQEARGWGWIHRVFKIYQRIKL